MRPTSDADVLSEISRKLTHYDALMKAGNGVDAERLMKQIRERLRSASKASADEAAPAKVGKGKPTIEITPEHLDLMARAVETTKPKTRVRGKDEGHPFWDQVLPLFEEHRADFLQITRRLALMLHKKLGRPITVDDIRDYYPPPAKYDSRVMGGIFAETTVWKKVGSEKSKRAECHHRIIALFDRVTLQDAA